MLTISTAPVSAAMAPNNKEPRLSFAVSPCGTKLRKRDWSTGKLTAMELSGAGIIDSMRNSTNGWTELPWEHEVYAGD